MSLPGGKSAGVSCLPRRFSRQPTQRISLQKNFRAFPCIHLKPLPFQQRLGARTTARVRRARSLSGGSFGAFNGARNATSSARSLICVEVCDEVVNDGHDATFASRSARRRSTHSSSSEISQPTERGPRWIGLGA